MARILVVDDTPDIRILLVAVLQKAGHDVIEAVDGTSVQSWVREVNPDLILLDLTMPNMDGWETLALLKSEPESRGIPVIISSALNSDQDLDRARLLGAVDYVPKPWAPADLLDRIRWAIAGNQKRRKKSA